MNYCAFDMKKNHIKGIFLYYTIKKLDDKISTKVPLLARDGR